MSQHEVDPNEIWRQVWGTQDNLTRGLHPMTLCDIEKYVINVEAVTFLEPATDEDSNEATNIHFVGGD